MKTKLYYDFLELIEKQDGMICKQSKIIIELANANAEQENMINVLMNEFSDR